MARVSYELILRPKKEQQHRLVPDPDVNAARNILAAGHATRPLTREMR